MNTYPSLKRLNLLNWTFSIETTQKKTVARPSIKEEKPIIEEFVLKIVTTTKQESLETKIDEACTFVWVSNDLEITAEAILMAYKTQSSVENRFKQLKSSAFVGALYLKTPERIIALTYLLLITLMLLSLMEYVVRRGLANDYETIICLGQIVMGRPTLLAIMRVMTLMSYRMLEYTDGSKVRIRSQKGLSESQLKILKYLELDEGIYLNGIR